MAADISTTNDRSRNGIVPSIELEAIGGPTASSWREQALTRIAELEDLTEVLRRESTEPWDILPDRIHRHLKTARDAASGAEKRSTWLRLKGVVAGSSLERTASNVDAAEADLLRLAPPGYLDGQLPSLVAHVSSHLAADDPRRQRVEALGSDRQRKALAGAD